MLADRVGIIDHGRIVAEGTPEALKAEIGRPTVEVDARPTRPTPSARDRDPRALRRARRDSIRGVAVRLRTGQADLAGIVRALDAEGIAIEQLQLHQPSLDDVFLAKTGRSLEGAGERRGGAERRRARDGAGADVGTVDQVYLLGRRSVVRTLRQPANVDRAARLPAAAAGGQLRRAEGGDAACRAFRRRSIVAFLLAVPFIQGALFATMNTGTDLARDIQTGFLSRLSLTPMRGVALLLGQLGGTRRARAAPGGRLHRRRPRSPASASRPGRPACSCCSSSTRSSCSRSARSASSRRCAPARGEAVQGLFPAFFVFLFISSMAIPRNLMSRRLVPRRRDREPGLVPDRGRAQPDRGRLGRRGARARVRRSPRVDRRDRDRARRVGAAAEAGARREDARGRARASRGGCCTTSSRTSRC